MSQDFSLMVYTTDVLIAYSEQVEQFKIDWRFSF